MFFPKIGETFILVLWGRPNPAIIMRMTKGVKGQGRTSGRRPERGGESPLQGVKGFILRFGAQPLEFRKKEGVWNMGKVWALDPDSQVECLLFWCEPMSLCLPHRAVSSDLYLVSRMPGLAQRWPQSRLVGRSRG